MRMLAAALAALLLFGCGSSERAVTRQEVAELRAKIIALEKTDGIHDSALTVLTDSHNSESERLTKRVSNLELATFDTGANLNAAGQEGYTFAETQLGKVLIIFRNAEPYLDGFKVKVGIGNPYSIDLSGLELTAAAGTNKLQKFSFPRTFAAGTWTDVELTFSPALAADVKKISVWVQFTSTLMRNASK